MRMTTLITILFTAAVTMIQPLKLSDVYCVNVMKISQTLKREGRIWKEEIFSN